MASSTAAQTQHAGGGAGTRGERVRSRGHHPMKRTPLPLVALVLGVGLWMWLATGPLGSRREEVKAGGRPSEESATAGAGALAAARGSGDRPRSARPGRSKIAGTVRRSGHGEEARVTAVLLAEPRTLPFTAGGTQNLVRLLSLPRPSSEPAAECRSSADGRYELAAIAAGTYRIDAIADDGGVGGAISIVELEGARASTDIVLDAGVESLSGRVVTLDGHAFGGALFVDSDSSSPPPEGVVASHRVALDPGGHFVATGLARGSVLLTAIEDGVSFTRSAPIALPHAGEVLLTVGAGTELRRGLVVAAMDGRPVENAVVIAGAQSAGDFLISRTATAADGTFTLAVGRARGGLRAIAAGFAPMRRPLEEIGEGLIEMRLERGARLEGRVRAGADGREIAGVSVRLMGESQSFFPADPVTTDAEGRYAFGDLPRGSVVVLAQGAGYSPKGIESVGGSRDNLFAVELRAGETSTLDLDMVPAVAVSGIVTDALGAPVAGAVVRAEGRQRAGSYYFLGTIENVSPSPTVTAADGTFSMPSLVGGAHYVFSARAADRVEGHSALLLLREQGAQAGVEIRLPLRRRIQVVVLEDEGAAPIAGAEVSIASDADDAVWYRAGPHAKTAADGRASLEVALPAPLRLLVQAAGHMSNDAVVVLDGDAPTLVRLVRGYDLVGSVVLADRMSWEQVEVEVRSDGSHPNDPTIYGTYIDAAGAFLLTFSTPGERTVRAGLRGSSLYSAVGVGVAGGAPITLVLRPRDESNPEPGSLFVRVFDPDGRPVPTARVQVDGMPSPREAHDGRLEVYEKRREGAVVIVSDAAAADGTPLPLGPGLSGPISATTSEVVVRLGPEKRIEGVVLSPSGAGVRGAEVWASWAAAPNSRESLFARASTGADGAFRLGRLGDVKCDLFVEPPDDFVSPEMIHVRPGTSGLEIRLRSGVRVRISALDAEGAPVAGIGVRAVRGELVNDVRGETAADGVARIAGLDPSLACTLEVEDEAGRFRARRIEAWMPADTTVRLQRALFLRGFVRDRTGRPISGAEVMASVSLSAGGTGICYEKSASDGSFEIAGLEEGKVSLTARVEGGEESEEVTAEAGGPAVLLTVEARAKPK